VNVVCLVVFVYSGNCPLVYVISYTVVAFTDSRCYLLMCVRS